MNELAIVVLSAALAAAPAPATPPEPGTLRQRLAAELLATEPAPAASPLPSFPVAEPAAAAADEMAPARLPTHPLVGSAAVSVPAWPALLLMVGLVGVWVWARRRAPRDGGVPLQRLASLPMGGRRSLVLVEVMRQRLLVGCSEKGLSLLARLGGPPSTEEAAADDLLADKRAFDHLLGATEAAEQRPPAAGSDRVPGEQRDLARKLRGLGRI